MTTPNTPQSTKKIEERFDDVLQNLDESYTRYYMSDFRDTSQEFEHPAVTILNTKQQLLTILKETCEGVLDEVLAEFHEHYQAQALKMGLDRETPNTAFHDIIKNKKAKLIGEDK